MNEVKIVDADDLRYNSIAKKKMKQYIQADLSRIVRNIRDADAAYITSIRHDLESVFNFPGMSNKESQTKIWAGIIRPLKEANYRVNLVYTNDECYINICWKSLKCIEDYNDDISLLKTVME